jgi:hypothetical protein
LAGGDVPVGINFSKTGLRDRAQLVGYAFRNGLAFPG